jgi:hypothetical protein
MIGDSGEALRLAVVTSEHEGGANCAKPSALRHRRGTRGGKGKQPVHAHPTDGKGKGKGKGKGESAPSKGRGKPYHLWSAVLRDAPDSVNLGKRKLHEADEAAQSSNAPGGDHQVEEGEGMEEDVADEGDDQ